VIFFLQRRISARKSVSGERDLAPAAFIAIGLTASFFFGLGIPDADQGFFHLI
jgi:hypothetical protein